MMRALAMAIILFSLPYGVAGAWAYPLDGYTVTGISRLEGYRLAQDGKVRGPQQPKGAMLTLDHVDLRLSQRQDLILPDSDPSLVAALKSFLGEEADRYGVAVLDLSDMQSPRYGELHGDYRANPGSVGKLMVALALFQALADIYPEDIEARISILRNTVVEASDFIHTDDHIVPFWEPSSPRISYRPLRVGDRANLWTYLDWMLSASSNAAASTVIRELMLMANFGRKYPVGAKEGNDFFRTTPRKQLTELLTRSLVEPVARNGLDPESLRQGSFFTSKANQVVPGVTSHATPRDLLRLLLRLEQGRIVDAFSSREMKRLMYMTQRRIRFASSPALNEAAVYFKSGSLYRCRPEPGFTCRKYEGNVENMMNSVAIVESPAEGFKLHYLVAVMSNVPRKNSAVAHQTFATRLHRLIESFHREGVGNTGKDRMRGPN
jgi:hypothetical protein